MPFCWFCHEAGHILSKVVIIFERHMVGSSKLTLLCADGKLRNEDNISFFLVIETHHCKLIVPRHDKTNKMSVRPAKTQIGLGIHPV